MPYEINMIARQFPERNVGRRDGAGHREILSSKSTALREGTLSSDYGNNL